jgi:hypothetical protein
LEHLAQQLANRMFDPDSKEQVKNISPDIIRVVEQVA